MSLQLDLGNDLGLLVYQFSFWVPPTQWEEVDHKTKQRVTKVTPIFAHARERVGTQCGRGKLYPPTKNIAEQANIRYHFIKRVQELDIEHHLPWSKGQTGVLLVGQEVPPQDYWPGKPHTKKPDNSNMLKQFEDAINPDKKTGFCGAYPDDCYVEPFRPTKRYGPVDGVLCTLYWFEHPHMHRPPTPRKKKAQNVTTL